MRLAALTLTATALLGLHHVHAEPLRAERSEPAVIARYEVRRAGGAPESLVVVRAADRIEHRYPGRHNVEVWRRMGSDVERLALYPDAKRAVRFSSGDLRALGEETDWQSLSGMVGADARAKLSQVGTAKVRGRAVPRLRGTLHGQPAELTWLPDEALPARLVVGKGEHALTMRLLDLTACTPETCAPTDGSALKVIDFSDLGDMTYDPFVKQFLHARGDHAH